MIDTYTAEQINLIKKIKIRSWNGVSGTTLGLKKADNEDSLKIKSNKNRLQICLADGHWGKEAALMATDFLIKTSKGQEEILAKKLVTDLQKKIYQRFGKIDMNPNKDFTSETSLISVVVDRSINRLTFFNYGDCRLHIYRNGKLFFKMKNNSTWLGVFSQLGLRKRLSVEQGLIFDTVELKKDDIVFIFTDGVDECIYETPTLDNSIFEKSLEKHNVESIFDFIFNKVFYYGAEDNASLVVLKF
jgi:serine/threonine protein phosphatase PrpC